MVINFDGHTTINTCILGDFKAQDRRQISYVIAGDSDEQYIHFGSEQLRDDAWERIQQALRDGERYVIIKVQ